MAQDAPGDAIAPTTVVRRGKARPNSLRAQQTALKKHLKAEARQRLTELVVRRFTPMVEAQMDKAIGQSIFMVKGEHGWTRVEDAEVIQAMMEEMPEPGTFWKIVTQDPDTQAAKYLLDQVIDKATEHTEVTGSDGEPLVIRWER